MSCAGTPSWSRGRGQGVRSRGRRLLDRIRFVAAFLTVVFGLPLSDATVVGGEKAVLECRVTVKPAAEVKWYVDTSFRVRGLRAGTDYYFRVVATSRSVRRDAIQRDALLARPDIERRSGDRGPRHRAVPGARRRRGRAWRGSGRGRPSMRSATWPSRPTANSASASASRTPSTCVGHTFSPLQQACSDIFVSTPDI